MKTQKEIEKDIVDYFKKYIESSIKIAQKEIESSIKIEKEHYTDFIKIPFTYYDYNAPISFAPDPIDFAIYGLKQKKVIAIEYPWRQKNGELTYNKIDL